MILNYSFLCHSHFLFSEDLCLPICETCNYDTKKGNLIAFIWSWISIKNLYLGFERMDIDKWHLRMLIILVCLINLVR